MAEPRVTTESRLGAVAYTLQGNHTALQTAITVIGLVMVVLGFLGVLIAFGPSLGAWMMGLLLLLGLAARTIGIEAIAALLVWFRQALPLSDLAVVLLMWGVLAGAGALVGILPIAMLACVVLSGVWGIFSSLASASAVIQVEPSRLRVQLSDEDEAVFLMEAISQISLCAVGDCYDLSLLLDDGTEEVLGLDLDVTTADWMVKRLRQHRADWAARMQQEGHDLSEKVRPPAALQALRKP